MSRWDAGRAEREKRNEEMADRYEDGWTCREIGDEYQLSDKRVWRILKDMGVEMRPRGPAPGTELTWLNGRFR